MIHRNLNTFILYNPTLCLNDVNFKIACYVANHEFETINFLTIGSQYIHIVNYDNIIYLTIIYSYIYIEYVKRLHMSSIYASGISYLAIYKVCQFVDWQHFKAD